MEAYFELDGKIKTGNIPQILFNILNRNINCRLILKGLFTIEAEILSKKLLFVKTDSKELSLGRFLLDKGIIDNEQYLTAGRYSINKHIRMGRALMELSIIDYKQLWPQILMHYKKIANEMFLFNSGEYKIITDFQVSNERILLNKDLEGFIMKGVKSILEEKSIISLMADKTNLYLVDKKRAEQLRFHPYDKHILDLVSEFSKLDEIIKRSELLENDTLRVLYILLLFGVVSESDYSRKDKAKDLSILPRNFKSFSNFEEIIDHYNKKFKFIFKFLSKEIGPVAYSVLFKGIENIIGKLPPALNKVQLASDGTVNKKVILKDIWYFSFNEIVDELTVGLEEILHSELHIVREHLGKGKENIVLKWIEK
jgi:hypothetical protein